jgi:hypothetical protein
MEMDEHLYVGTWSNQTDWPAMIEAIASGELPDIFGGGENPLAFIGLIASDGGEIWRHDGGQNWTRVAKADPDVTGFRKMIKYGGRLYAATANALNGAELWVKEPATTSSEETWSVVPWGDGNKDPNNSSIRALCIFGEGNQQKLYVGTENNETGGELWAYDDDGGFVHMETFPAQSVAEIAVFDGTLYVGTWTFEFNFTGGPPSDTFQLFASSDGDDFENVKPTLPVLQDLNNVGVMKLIEHKNRLYLGTVNYVDGFTLLSSEDPWNPDSWTVHTIDGFGNSDNAYFWSAVVIDDMLVAGTFNTGITGGVFPVLPMDGRAEIFYTKDGEIFEKLIDDGFGVPFTYGVRSMLVSDGQLFVGTATNVLIPDLQSSLYDSNQIAEMLSAVLDSQDPSYLKLAPFLLEGLLNLDSPPSDDPFIGTQIWTSPVGKPGKGKTK